LYFPNIPLPSSTNRSWLGDADFKLTKARCIKTAKEAVFTSLPSHEDEEHAMQEQDVMRSFPPLLSAYDLHCIEQAVREGCFDERLLAPREVSKRHNFNDKNAKDGMYTETGEKLWDQFEISRLIVALALYGIPFPSSMQNSKDDDDEDEDATPETLLSWSDIIRLAHLDGRREEEVIAYYATILLPLFYSLISSEPHATHPLAKSYFPQLDHMFHQPPLSSSLSKKRLTDILSGPGPEPEFLPHPLAAQHTPSARGTALVIVLRLKQLRLLREVLKLHDHSMAKFEERKREEEEEAKKRKEEKKKRDEARRQAKLEEKKRKEQEEQEGGSQTSPSSTSEAKNSEQGGEEKEEEKKKTTTTPAKRRKRSDLEGASVRKHFNERGGVVDWGLKHLDTQTTLLAQSLPHLPFWWSSSDHDICLLRAVLRFGFHGVCRLFELFERARSTPTWESHMRKVLSDTWDGVHCNTPGFVEDVRLASLPVNGQMPVLSMDPEKHQWVEEMMSVLTKEYQRSCDGDAASSATAAKNEVAPSSSSSLTREERRRMREEGEEEQEEQASMVEQKEEEEDEEEDEDEDEIIGGQLSPLRLSLLYRVSELSLSIMECLNLEQNPCAFWTPPVTPVASLPQELDSVDKWLDMTVVGGRFWAEKTASLIFSGAMFSIQKDFLSKHSTK
jgi:flagellar biosynthesis GTPase FlhF